MSGRRGPLLLLALALVGALAGAVAVGAWIVDGAGEQSAPSTQQRVGGAEVAGDARELARLSRPVGHAVYWVGPLAGQGYELTHTEDGRAYVRYLPAGTSAGDPRPGFLTVGTYLLQDAFAVTLAAAKRADSRAVRVPGGAVAFYSTARPQSVYLAYEGSDLQIEVFHPAPSQARRLVAQGRVRSVG
jgi:hypothetical protein